jgi:hypothetical protein
MEAEVPGKFQKNEHGFENIYFPGNFPSYQCFLSVYEKESKNLIVLGDNKSPNTFLREFFPSVSNIYIPNFITGRWSPIKTFFVSLYYKHKIKKILPIKNAYFFSHIQNIMYYSVLNYLKENNVKIHFIEGAKGTYQADKITEHLDTKNKIRLWMLGKAVGEKVAIYNMQSAFNMFGLNTKPEESIFNLLSWDEIREKFSYNKKKIKDNVVLVVDLPIQKLPSAKININVQKTQSNLITYFSSVINKGREIHLKPHYNTTNGMNSFQGTDFQDNIKILPHCMPVELILNQYREVYFFTSITLDVPLQWKKKTLINLIEFESSKDKKKLMDVFYINARNELNSLQFAEKIS